MCEHAGSKHSIWRYNMYASTYREMSHFIAIAYQKYVRGEPMLFLSALFSVREIKSDYTTAAVDSCPNVT